MHIVEATIRFSDRTIEFSSRPSIVSQRAILGAGGKSLVRSAATSCWTVAASQRCGGGGGIQLWGLIDFPQSWRVLMAEGGVMVG